MCDGKNGLAEERSRRDYGCDSITWMTNFWKEAAVDIVIHYTE